MIKDIFKSRNYDENYIIFLQSKIEEFCLIKAKRPCINLSLCVKLRTWLTFSTNTTHNTQHSNDKKQ